MNEKKGLLKMSESLNKLQAVIEVKVNYIGGSMEKFIESLRNTRLAVRGNLKDKNLMYFIATELDRFQKIVEVLQTKKISQNISDFIILGEYIKELGEEIRIFGQTQKFNKPDGTETDSELEALVDITMDTLFDEIFGSEKNTEEK